MKVATCARRDFLVAAGAAAIAPLVRGQVSQTTGGEMYGLISKIKTVPGQRDALAAVLVESAQAMPGCLSYVIASDHADDDALWITEVWDSQASHRASLSLPAVRAAVAKGRPMIAGFSSRVETMPIGGYGIDKAASR